MSKMVDEREDTELKALTLVEKLATHTFVKCKSFKCPKRERWLFPDRMRQHALDAMTCTAAANGTFIGPGPNLETNYHERHLQHLDKGNAWRVRARLIRRYEELTGDTFFSPGKEGK